VTRLVTIGMVYAITAICIIWDIYAVIEPTPGDTFSKVALKAFTDHPSIAYLVGGVLGHFCSNLGNSMPVWWLWASLPALILTTAALILIDFKWGFPSWLCQPVWFLLVGQVLTFFLWPQKEM